MPTLIEQVVKLNNERRKIDEAFRAALNKAHGTHSWSELADATGMSKTGIRYLAENLNAQRGTRRSS